MSASPRTIRLVEYRSATLSRGELSEEQGSALHTRYGDRVAVEPPSFKNGYTWQLQSQGWVGHLPVSTDLHIAIDPKVPIGNLLRMLEYAYALHAIEFPDIHTCGSLAEFYERLANILAKRVLLRARRGLYATYLGQQDALPFVRGSLDVRSRLRRPWDTRLHCEYQEHTADVEENQILAWTLSRIARSGLCSERVLPQVRHAYHAVQGRTSSVPFLAAACVGRLYNRLNLDYRPLHALCRFFLENGGPTRDGGQHQMVPFVVEMSLLFERFVAEWLIAHLPPSIELRYQEIVHVGKGDQVRLEMDMVLYDTRTERPICVLDAKYKAPEKANNADLYQVVAYSDVLGCDQAILIYPAPVPVATDALWGHGGKRVRTAVFSLEGDLEQAGRALLGQLDLPKV